MVQDIRVGRIETRDTVNQPAVPSHDSILKGLSL